jgi:hypothetical protein
MVISGSGLFDLDHFTPVVKAAGWAYLVGRLLLMALGAVHEIGDGEGVTCAAFVSASLRVAASGIRHG